jgi:ubiquinol-cytochrome c reductase cytochrome c subunit
MHKPHRAAVAVLACGLAVAVRGSQEPEDKRPGRAEYVALGCHQCHGYEGQGARGTGPRIAPKPLPLEAFSIVVRHPPDVMPAYSPKVLGEDTLKRIHEYLRSIPPPPDVSTLPALSGS